MSSFPSVKSNSGGGDKSSGKKNEHHHSRKAQKGGKSGGFQTLGLSRPVFQGIMRLGYKVPTPIQRKTLPFALAGRDVVAMARTGSGKTASFLIPLLERLAVHSMSQGVRGLVLSPTRELAQQTHKFCTQMGKFTGLRVCLIQGGDSLDAQFTALSNNPDILVATPGRVVHLLAEVSEFKLGRIEMLIVDEADRLFEMGFAMQLHEIFKQVPESRQTLLFSATMPRQLVDFARAGLTNPELVRLDTDTKISENLKLAFFFSRTQEKAAALLHLVREVLPKDDHTIVFAATRHHVEYVSALLRQNDVAVSVAYGSMDMEAREKSLADFRAGRTSVLVVTDVAARGLDIPLLNNVVNYEFPATAKLFVHRVGRAARQGRHGCAFSFITQDELPFLVDVHLYLGRPLLVAGQATPDDDIGINSNKANNSQKAVGGGKLIKYTLNEMNPEQAHYGRFPQSVLDSENERLRLVLQDSSELQQDKKSMENAHQLYSQTRPEASRRSLQRAKDLNKPGIHPLLLESSNAGEQVLDGQLTVLRKFRPKQTVFEVAEAKKGKSQSSNEMTVVMKQKRRTHQRTIAETDVKNKKKNEVKVDEFDDDIDLVDDETMAIARARAISSDDLQDEDMEGGEASKPDVNTKKRQISKAERKRAKKAKVQINTRITDVSKTPAAAAAVTDVADGMEERVVATTEDDNGGFRDPQYYISVVTEDQVAQDDQLRIDQGPGRLEDAMLDLNPDEKRDIASKTRTYHWDKRKNKYIKATMEEHMQQKRMRGESGAAINVKARGEAYKRWQDKTKRRVETQGSMEESGGQLDRDATNVKKIAHMNRQTMIANAGVVDELKDETTIRRDQKVMKKKMDKNARGGRGGARGGGSSRGGGESGSDRGGRGGSRSGGKSTKKGPIGGAKKPSTPYTRNKVIRGSNSGSRGRGRGGKR